MEGGGRRKALEAALLELFRKEAQSAWPTSPAEEAEKKMNPAGGHRKKGQGGTTGGSVGFDKRQLLEKLNYTSTSGEENGMVAEEEEEDDGRARVRVDERTLGAALKGLVSRGVLRVHQGRWCLAAAPQAPAPSMPTGGSGQEDDNDPADEDEPPATSARERKKNKKWEKLPHGISEVVPGFLYLGSARDAEDEAQLQALGITHVLNVAKEWHKPRHCKYLDSLTAYKRVPLEDRLSEVLFPIVEDEALAFIERARADHPTTARVLVHCVLGKSRSASAVVAYLVRHRGMTLRQAYLHVLEQRKTVVVVRPNRSFVAQLMAWEVTTTMTTTAAAESTLSWDDVDSGCADLQAWLADASLKTPLSGSRSKKVFNKEQGSSSSEVGTHLWWALGDKPEYCIPADREAELLSEYAKAYLRGEELCLIERRTSPRYRMYFDLDIKCSLADDQPRPSLSDVLHLFLPFFARVFSDFFGAGQSESTDDQCPRDGVTLSVNWKYGFHLVWDLATTVPRHRAFLKALVKHLEPQWETAEAEGGATTIPDYIRRVNPLSELIDSAIFTSTDTLRLLYSSKNLACKACKTKQPGGPRKGGKQKATPLAKPKAKGGKECEGCGGTGRREGRVYEWLGFFDARSGLHDAARTAALQPPAGAGLVDAVKSARRRIETCSIRLATQDQA